MPNVYISPITSGDQILEMSKIVGLGDPGVGQNRAAMSNGNDTVTGSIYADNIQGRNGNDLLKGGDGNDWLAGEAGNDRLLGEKGNDYLFGHAGDDTLNGGQGNDSLYGGEGNDTYVIYTFSGLDLISDGSLIPGVVNSAHDVLYFPNVPYNQLEARAVTGTDDLQVATLTDWADGINDNGVTIQHGRYVGSGTNQTYVIEYLAGSEGVNHEYLAPFGFVY